MFGEDVVITASRGARVRKQPLRRPNVLNHVSESSPATAAGAAAGPVSHDAAASNPANVSTSAVCVCGCRYSREYVSVM